MNIFRLTFLVLSIALLFSLTGCQGDNSQSIPDINSSVPDDNGTTLPPIDVNATTDAKKLSIINGNQITVTGSGEEKDIYIMAFNSSGSTNTAGKITFQWPLEFINNGTDLGTVSPGTATIVDGRVHFVYKAPADLAATQKDFNRTNFLFHSTDSGDVNVTLIVDFNATGDYSSANPVLKTLVLSDSDLTVSSSNQIDNLTLFAYTDQSTTNINTSLLVKYPSDIITNKIDIGYLPSEITITNGRADFVYNGPKDIQKTISELTTTGSSTPVILNLYDQSTGVDVNLSLDFNTNATPSKYKNYVLKAYPENNVTVIRNSQSKVLEVYLEDNSTNIPVSGELVIIEFFDSSKGKMNVSSGTTDSGGRIVFNYTAPSDIAGLSPLPITFKLSAATSITSSTTVLFDSSQTTKDYSAYTISLVDANRTITTASQTEVFDVFLKDGSSNPAEGDTITLDFFDGNSGTVNAFKGVTDANGHVAFNYTAPADISDLNGTVITFRVENTTIAGNRVTSTFSVDSTTADDKYKNYELTVVPEGNFTIVSGSQIQTIDIYLEDNSTSKPVASELVNLQFFDGKKGSMNLFSTSTDANGHAAFQYTAPSDIADVNGTNLELVFVLDKNTTTTVTTKAIFDSSQTTKDYSAYTISLVDANRTITTASQTEVFDVFLKDGSSNPAEGDTITLDFFDGNSGTVNAFKGVTDANGHVAFNYTAPADISDLNGTVITFRVENTTIAGNRVTSTFTVASTVTQKPNIHVDDTDATVTLTQDAETLKVKILAFNDDNEVFNSGSIVVRYPSEIVDDNVSGGKFTQSEVSIVDGEAIFDFIGPDNLVQMNSLNFTFVYKEDNDRNTTLTIVYSPLKPTIILTENTKEVTLNSEVVSIDVKVIDDKQNPYPSGNVKIEYPRDVIDGRDIGSFAESTIELVNGTATFTYTSPSKLDDNTSDIVFSFYHENASSSSKDFTITINPEANQTVLTSYTLSTSISDNNITMDLNNSKPMSFYVKDDNSVLVPDANMTSIKITMLNPMLGTLVDTLGNEGNTLTIVNKNSVSINLKSNTISGIIPLEVEAKFSDVNDKNQTLSEVFNIVVLSGPPSAMSLSYAGAEQDESNAKFTENWVLTVTDRYNNRVDSKPAVSMGLMAGYTQDSNSTPSVNNANYLYYTTSDGNGTLSGVNNNFTAKADVFANVDQTNDYLVTFGNGYRYNASGKWNINTNNDNKILDLVDDYNGSDTDELGFAVGNNYRQDVCEDAVEWVGNVYPKDNNYIIGSTGSMIIKVEYDYYLTGKDAVLWVNLVGAQHDSNSTVRIGEAKKITLRASGIESAEYSLSVDYNGTISLPITISNTVEPFKNSNFAYAIKTSSTVVINNVVTSSMSNIYSCGLNTVTGLGNTENHNGRAYVDVNVTTTSGQSGTIQLVNLLISNEF